MTNDEIISNRWFNGTRPAYKISELPGDHVFHWELGSLRKLVEEARAAGAAEQRETIQKCKEALEKFEFAIKTFEGDIQARGLPAQITMGDAIELAKTAREAIRTQEVKP